MGLYISKFWATPQNFYFGETEKIVIVTKTFTFISLKGC